MHIVMTVNAAWNIWNFRRPLVQALIANGHRVTVLAPPDESIGDIMRLGCRFEPLEMSIKGLNPLEDIKLVRRFKKIFDTERPDIVLSYTIKNNLFGAMAARLSGVPFIPNVTGLGTAFLSGGLLERVAEGLYRHSFAALPVVFFQNMDDRDLFVKRRLVNSQQARVVPGSGIDLTRFAPVDLPLEAESPVFLMIARLLRDKGVMEYVEAARQLNADTPQARYQLLGASDTENRTAIDVSTIRNWHDQGIIEYLGSTTDVRPYIAAAHCIVLPSYREGAPRTLIEAASMARPLIATDVPGCRSVLQHDMTGLFCQPRSGASLAAACRRFLSYSHSDKVAMGIAGRRKMERQFDQSIVVKAYLDAIKELTGAR